MDELLGKALSSGHTLPILGVTGSSLDDWVQVALHSCFRHILIDTHASTTPSAGRDVAKWLQTPHTARDQLFITAQLPITAKPNANVRSQCLKCLYNLRCEYFDLVVLNKLESNQTSLVKDQSSKQHILQAWQALESLVGEGQTRTLGVHNWDPTEIEYLLSQKAKPPEVLLIDWSSIREARGLLFKLQNYCKYRQIQLVISLQMQDIISSDDKWCVCVRSLAAKYQRPTVQVAAKAIHMMNLPLVMETSQRDDIKEGFKVLDWTMHPADLKILQDSIYD